MVKASSEGANKGECRVGRCVWSPSVIKGRLYVQVRSNDMHGVSWGIAAARRTFIDWRHCYAECHCRVLYHTPPRSRHNCPPLPDTASNSFSISTVTIRNCNVPEVRSRQQRQCAAVPASPAGNTRCFVQKCARCDFRWVPPVCNDRRRISRVRE